MSGGGECSTKAICFDHRGGKRGLENASTLKREELFDHPEQQEVPKGDQSKRQKKESWGKELVILG